MIDLLETFENAVFSQYLCWITGFSDSLFLRDKAHERAQLWLLFWAMASRFPADGMDGSPSGSWVGAEKNVSREEKKKTCAGREKSNIYTTYKNGDLEDCLWMMVAIFIIYGLLYTTINDCLPSICFTHSDGCWFYKQFMTKMSSPQRRSTCLVKVTPEQIPNRLRRFTSIYNVYVFVYILFIYIYECVYISICICLNVFYVYIYIHI